MTKRYISFINEEEKRQNSTLSFIASENYVSNDVKLALGSCFTNKYAEGYSGNRYYAGNTVVDEVEEWTKELGLQIFGLDKMEWGINVQPYSGSPANLAIYCALLDNNDKILSLKLNHGGHLTHGHKVSFSSRFFDFEHYGVSADGFFDYDEIEKIAKEKKPKLIVAGATAYSRKIDFKKFRLIADKVGAFLMADISHIAGLIVAKLHPDCFPYADVVMSTTHKTLRGPRGAIIISRKSFSKKIDSAVFPGLQGGPHENVVLAQGVAFSEAIEDSFKKYQKNVIKNASILSEELIKNGIKLVSGGTDNHLLLLDISDYDISSLAIQNKLEELGIVANRNSIPYDKKSPLDPSGIRLGTPAVTTRGLGGIEMKKIAEVISRTIKNIDNTSCDWNFLKKTVSDIVKKYPLK